MPGSDPLSLEQRVARLERLVARLVEQEVEAGVAGEAPWPGQGPSATRAAPGPGSASGSGSEASGFAQAQPEAKAGLADQGERWLGRVGVAFVVLAFGFLFRYAFDQGWIGPAFRVALGFLAATAMLAVGLRLERTRERYSQYLLGGAVGVYYIVGYAAYELYALVPFTIAFAFMCAVTVLAFVLAERQRQSSLAVIGAAGGLATPFLVNTGAGNVPSLVAYTTLLLAGAGALQFLRGWRRLLLVLGFGGLAVMALAVDRASGPAIVETAITALGIFAAWALFGVLPLLRTRLHRMDPETWAVPPLPEWVGRWVGQETVALAMLRIGCVMGSLLAVLELGGLLSVERATFGLLFGVGAVVFVALGRLFFETRLALKPSAETAAVLAILAVSLFFFDYRVMLPLAVLGAAMHSADGRWRLPGVAVLGHVLFAQLLILVVGRLDVVGVASGSPFGMREMAALGAIVLAFTTSFVFESATPKRVYRIGAHVAFMVWLATQFSPMERGQELISLSWGSYGIVLLLLSLRMRERGVQAAGLVTLGIVAAKLLLVDMAQVDVIWRILLFMGFGGAFLGLSYLINRQAESPDRSTPV